MEGRRLKVRPSWFLKITAHQSKFLTLAKTPAGSRLATFVNYEGWRGQPTLNMCPVWSRRTFKWNQTMAL